MSLLEILNRALWITVFYKKRCQISSNYIVSIPHKQHILIYNSSELWSFSVLELSGMFAVLYCTVQQVCVCVFVCIIHIQYGGYLNGLLDSGKLSVCKLPKCLVFTTFLS